MTELLDAIDALTKPTVERVEQDTDAGVKVTRVEQAPLLDRLEEAIAASIGVSGGTGMVDRYARNVLDSDALYHATRITAAITDWCRMIGIRAERHASRDLRSWYAARLATNPTTESDQFYERELHGWAIMIRAKLNPPKSWEVPAPCPQCAGTTWTDTYTTETGAEATIERPRPVLVEYWPGSDDILTTAKGTCRRCGREWRGSTELRALRWDIDNLETTIHTNRTQEEQ